MATRYPIEYDLRPKTMPTGRRWMTLTVKNIGVQPLTGLDVRLHSLDPYGITIFGTGEYIPILGQDEERLVTYQVSASSPTSLYVSIDAWQDGRPFHWESPYLSVIVGERVAEIVNAFAMTAPYAALEEKIDVEATVRAEADIDGLTLEFWADTPSGEFKQLGSTQTKSMKSGEEATYSAEFTPEEDGSYKVYVYLYDDGRRIDREIDYVFAGSQTS